MNNNDSIGPTSAAAAGSALFNMRTRPIEEEKEEPSLES